MKQIIGVVFLVFVIIIGMIVVEANDPNRKNNTESIVEESSSIEYEEKIIITISGEVNKPGVYETDVGNYLQEVINQAGGITNNADETCFNYYLVLAEDISLYIPPKKESEKVSINNSTLDELTTLTGIGNTLGNRIIEYRDKIGEFAFLEQIMEVDGIGKSIFHKIKDDICL